MDQKSFKIFLILDYFLEKWFLDTAGIDGKSKIRYHEKTIIWN